jgi:Transcriptional regulator/sugar kinase
MLVGSIEAGGTKFVCAVGDDDYRIQDQVQFPTTTPEETLGRVVDYFKKFSISAIGIGSFGPIEIKKIRLNTAILLQLLNPNGVTRTSLAILNVI